MTRRRARELVDAASRPAFWSVALVRLASQGLPRSVRDRYRREFVAELYGMDRSRQLGHATGVVLSVWALHRAVAHKTSDIEEAEMQRRPVMCTINAHHVWRSFSTEDGGRYRRCIRCGKDNSGTGGAVGGGFLGAG